MEKRGGLAGINLGNLEIWQEAMELAETIYRLTRSWPEQERYGLTAQCRRAAVSVPANIAEGVGRNSPAERSRFGQIALGSLYELDTLLELAYRLGFTTNADFEAVDEKIARLAKRLQAYILHWREA